MPWLIILALIALPVIEIALFIKSAQWIGVLPTVLMAIAAGMIGLALVRTQGMGMMFRARAQLERGEFPVAEAFDGLCLAFAGLLLFLPGFFTDFVALPLLLPPVRSALRLWLGRTTRTIVTAGRPHPGGPYSGGPQPNGPPPVIDADYHVVGEDDDNRHR